MAVGGKGARPADWPGARPHVCGVLPCVWVWAWRAPTCVRGCGRVFGGGLGVRPRVCGVVVGSEGLLGVRLRVWLVVAPR